METFLYYTKKDSHLVRFDVLTDKEYLTRVHVLMNRIRIRYGEPDFWEIKKEREWAGIPGIPPEKDIMVIGHFFQTRDFVVQVKIFRAPLYSKENVYQTGVIHLNNIVQDYGCPQKIEFEWGQEQKNSPLLIAKYLRHLGDPDYNQVRDKMMSLICERFDNVPL